MTDPFRRQCSPSPSGGQPRVIRFEKGQRKDDVMHKRLRTFKPREGVIFIGVAQEKVRVPRTTRKRLEEGGAPFPGLSIPRPWSTSITSTGRRLRTLLHQVLLLLPLPGQALPQRPRIPQRATGPARHRLRGAGQRPLALCEPAAAQRISDGFRETKIQRLFRKWLAALPHPYSARPQGRLSLRSVGSPSGVLPDPDLGSPATRALLLRGSHPRKHRFGPS